MNLEQLRIFVAAAQHGSFTLAAASLGITQSAISISMRKLEEAHDVVLFDRIGNGLSLTDAGRALLKEAQRIISDVDLTIRRIETYRYAPKRHLIVACSRNVYDHWMPPIVASFLSRGDLPQIELAVGAARDITSWVMRGTVDFGLTEAPPGHSPLRYWEVFEDRLRLFAGPDLVRRLGPGPEWSALEDISPVLWECNGDTEPILLNAFEDKQIREKRIRHPNLSLQSMSAVYSVVAGGRHAAYLSQRFVEGFAGHCAVAVPAFDIPVKYWLFGPHQGLGELLSSAVKTEAERFQPPVQQQASV